MRYEGAFHFLLSSVVPTQGRRLTSYSFGCLVPIVFAFLIPTLSQPKRATSETFPSLYEACRPFLYMPRHAGIAAYPLPYGSIDD